MKTNFFQMALLALPLLFLPGCAADKAVTPKADQNITGSLNAESRYFYVTEAELQRKKGNIDAAIMYMKKAIDMDPESSFLRRELTVLYLQNKEDQNAIKEIETLLDKNPNDVEALIIYGRMKQGLKQMEDARKAFEKVLSIDPTQKNIYLFLGSLYMEAGDHPKALKVYGQLVKNFPDAYLGYFFLGKIHAQQGQIQEAEREFQKTLELEPDLEEPRFELLSIYKAQKKTDKVIETYLEILKRGPDNIRAAMEMGSFYHEIGNAQEAEAVFKDLGIRSASDPEVIRKLVLLYLDAKKYEPALIVLEGMLKGAPDNSALHYFAGAAYYQKGDKPAALMHFKQVTQDSNFYQEAAFHIAAMYREQGKIREAIDFLNDVIKKIPKSPDLLLYLGTFHEEIEEFDKAEMVLKQGLEVDPNNVKLHFRLGVVYDKWGKKEASVETMKTVISLDPKHANALNYLGYTYADLGTNLDEAERLIQEALKYKPDDGYITDSLGWVYFKKGLLKKAIQFLEKAAALVPDDPVILEHLGDAYLKTSDKKKALDFYKRSLLNKKKDTAEIKKKIQELSGEDS